MRPRTDQRRPTGPGAGVAAAGERYTSAVGGVSHASHLRTPVPRQARQVRRLMTHCRATSKYPPPSHRGHLSACAGSWPSAHQWSSSDAARSPGSGTLLHGRCLRVAAADAARLESESASFAGTECSLNRRLVMASVPCVSVMQSPPTSRRPGSPLLPCHPGPTRPIRRGPSPEKAHACR